MGLISKIPNPSGYGCYGLEADFSAILKFLMARTILPTAPTKNPSGQTIIPIMKKKGSSPPFQKLAPKK